MKKKFRKLKLWFQTHKDLVFYKRLIYRNSTETLDNFGSNKKYIFTVAIYKLYSLEGRFYQIDVGDCFMTDKNIYRLIGDMLVYINEKGLGKYRLEEYMKGKI